MKRNLFKGIYVIFALFLALLIFLNSYFLSKIDSSISSFFKLFNHPLLISLMIKFNLITNFYLFLMLVIVVFVYFIYFKKEREAFLSSFALVFGIILSYLFKVIIRKSRPESDFLVENSYGFPSSHATISTILFLIFMFYIMPNIKEKKSRFFLFVFSLFLFLITLFNRLILGVHWFSDVIGGVLLGILVFFFVKKI